MLLWISEHRLAGGHGKHSKDLETGWADVKRLLLECSMANNFMPQQYFSVAFREEKSQKCGKAGTGKQHWKTRILLPIKISL